MDKIKIVAAILDTDQLTLYDEGGQTTVIRQGDPRVQRIIDEVTTPLSTQGWAEVSIAMTDPERNSYLEFQQLAQNIVQFFRVNRSLLRNILLSDDTEVADNGLFGQDRHVRPVSLGTVPAPNYAPDTADITAPATPTASDVTDATPNQRPVDMREATRQIMEAATPVSDRNFTTRDTDPERDTMIATVADPVTGEVQIIPGMEHLQPQFRAAAKLGSTEGVTRFLQRIAAVISDRGHTIDELLRFMSKGDLPIADDGSIVAYKVLESSTPAGYYVDCHSKQVRQRIGSFVSQQTVDPNRRVECSQGLHIARRGYLGGFSGDVIVLVKIAPEDVIAVPLNEPNKMRARGYHVLSEVPKNEHVRLRSNQPVEGTEAKKLLGLALQGKHVDVIEDVVIGGPNGGGVTVTPRQGELQRRNPKPGKNTQAAEPISTETPDVLDAPKVDPKGASELVVEQKTKTEQRRLFDAGSFAELVALRKAKKKSWEAWGFSPDEVTRIEAGTSGKPGTMGKADQANQEKTVSGIVPIVEASPEVEPEVEAQVPSSASTTAKQPTRQEKAKALLDVIEKGRTKNTRRQAYQDLLALKKASKVGWMQLGVDNFEVIQGKFEK